MIIPDIKTAVHPSGLTISFREADHSYVDSTGRTYISATTLIGQAFRPFDSVGVASLVAEKRGGTPEEWIATWAERGDIASERGTRAHYNAEQQILGAYDRILQPDDTLERDNFIAVWDEVNTLKAHHKELNPEMIVFSPRFGVAGSIDLLCRKDYESYTMVDWKLVKKLKKQGYWGATGCHPATIEVQDANFLHYALQLSLYEMILKLESYIALGVNVTKELRWVTNGKVKPIELPDMRLEALTLLAFNATTDGLTNNTAIPPQLLNKED